MALRALQGPTGGGTPVGGTGSPNTIPSWTGPSTLGDSVIRQDDGTNRLLVAGGVAATSTAGAPIRINGQDATGPGNFAGGHIFLMPGTRQGVGAIGSVGVNQTNPNARLHIGESDNLRAFGSSGSARGVTFIHTVTESQILGVDQTLAGSYQPLVLGASTLGFNTNGTTRAVTIDTSGNVGIGTASPSSYEAGARQLVVGSGTGNQGITIAGNNNLNLYFATGTTGALQYRGFIRYDAADDSMWFATTSTVRWKVTGTGHFIANVDNTYDIGASGATRPRTVYAGTGVVGGYLRAGAASAGVASTTTIGNTTSTTATAGAQTLPANPLGFIVAHVGTTEVRIPYYAV